MFEPVTELTKKKIVVFTPTWNEAENIEKLILEIHRELPAAHILIVDDNSPDGTPDIVRKLMEKIPNLHLKIRQGPRGRGLAGIDAYIWALDFGAQYIVEMDADFSHQPKYLKYFVSALDQAEVVIGSRYTPGGRDLRPGIHRRIISRLANFYQRKMFGTSILDCTSGYRAYRAYVLESIGVRKLNTWGPAILSDVLYRIVKNGFVIKEIPITFPDREKGKSTLTLKILFEGFLNVAKLKFH